MGRSAAEWGDGCEDVEQSEPTSSPIDSLHNVLEKLPVPQLFKKFPSIFAVPSLTAVFTTARCFALISRRRSFYFQPLAAVQLPIHFPTVRQAAAARAVLALRGCLKTVIAVGKVQR